MKKYLVIFVIFLMNLEAEVCQEQRIFDAEEFIKDSEFIHSQGKAAIQSLQGKSFEEIPREAKLNYIEQISEGDLLQIVLFHPKRRDLMETFFSVNENIGGFLVTDGAITVPHAGKLQVVGLSLVEVKNALKMLFQKRLKDVDVFVTFKQKRSNRVEITGMASNPFITVNGKIDLYEVLSKANLHSDANLFASYVLRNEKILPIDLHRLIKEGDLSQNIVMKGGDKIYIASPLDQFALVMGAVGVQRPIPLPSGFISLREALVVAYGVPYVGDKNHIQVIRGGTVTPKIYTLAWDCLIHEPNKNLLLIPGDVVYVSLKPITEWNLFLQQLEGTVNLFFAGKIIYQLVK